MSWHDRARVLDEMTGVVWTKDPVLIARTKELLAEARERFAGDDELVRSIDARFEEIARHEEAWRREKEPRKR